MTELTAPLDELKPREREILTLMAAGYSNQAIADALYITKETVRWYNKQIYSKLGTSRRTKAIALARQFGLVDANPTESETTPRYTLPTLVGPFIGREADLAAVTELLQQPDVRLLSLVAMGGMGKSTLALALGNQLQATFADGAVFVDLTTVADGGDVAAAAASALNLPLGRKPAREALLQACRDKALLLIFDNFEHVLAGAHLLAELLAAAPKVKVVATSRVRLNLRSETVYGLGPVPAGNPLFRAVAHNMHPAVALTPADDAAIDQIVTLVGGLPLALVLAAAWLDTLTAAEIAAEIASGLELLEAEMGDMPDRHRSIRAVFEPTWQQLAPAEQEALAAAAIFRGGFTRQALQAVSGASLRTVQQLRKRALITPTPHPQRFDMHPLLRQHAVEKLATLDGEHRLRQAHAQDVLTYFESETQRLKSTAFEAALTALAVEHDNLRAALDWAFDAKESDTGVALTLVGFRFWQYRSDIRSMQHYLERALSQRPDNALIHARLAIIYNRLGQLEKANETARRGVQLAEQGNDLRVLAAAKYMFANMHSWHTPTEENVALAREAVALAKAHGDNTLVASTLQVLASLTGQMDGKLAESIESLETAVALQEAVGDHQSLSRVLHNLGLLYIQANELSRSQALIERSLALKRKIGDHAGIVRRLYCLAVMHIVDEEFDVAQAQLAESRRLCTDLEEPQRLIGVLLSEGVMFVVQGENRDARDTLQSALQLATEINNRESTTLCHRQLSLVYTLQGDLAAALPHLRAALNGATTKSRDIWGLLLAAAHYAWYAGKPDAAARAVIGALPMIASPSTYTLVETKYILQPLLYRIERRFGRDAWAARQAEWQGVALGILLEEAQLLVA